MKRLNNLKNIQGLFVIAALLIAFSAGASEVVQVGEGQNFVIISQSETRLWRTGDEVCIFRTEENLACGIVNKANAKVARVQISDSREIVKKEDKAMLMTPSRAPASVSEILAKVTKRPTYNTLVGMNMALDILFPKIDLQGFLTEKVTLGFQPSFSRRTSLAGDTMLALGFMFTLNYYDKKDYRGLWLQGGSGIYVITNKIAGLSISSKVPALQLIVGWRESWALGLNIGIGLGLRYIAFPDVSVAELQFKSFQPFIAVDLGFNY